MTSFSTFLTVCKSAYYQYYGVLYFSIITSHSCKDIIPSCKSAQAIQQYFPSKHCDLLSQALFLQICGIIDYSSMYHKTNKPHYRWDQHLQLKIHDLWNILWKSFDIVSRFSCFYHFITFWAIIKNFYIFR